MSAPDPKAVEGAIAKLARDGGCDCADCRARVTLIAAANAYLRAPTAPQGAEPVAYRTQLSDGEWLTCAAGEKLERDWRAIEGVDLQPLYAAPQGAEIVREPDDNMLAEGADFLSAIRRGTVTGTDKDLARGMFMRMYDAALTPTDAETKHGS